MMNAVTAIQNPGFESGLDQWEQSIYGAKPVVSIDTKDPHNGKASLRIESKEPSDVALGQNITLKAGQAYRLNGWIKTQDLKPTTARIWGTIQVQSVEGGEWLGTGKSHSGNTPWTQESVVFVAPSNGKVRIALFFAGFGQGQGAAWFDDLKLEEIDLAKSPYTITKQPLVNTKISPMQYGQFIEYLCNLVPGMWAEKLYDGSFEGLSPYSFAYIKESDYHEQPWYRSGYTNRSSAGKDATVRISGDHSMRIEIGEGAPAISGISQDGLAFKKGETLHFSIFARLHDCTSPVRIKLHDKDGKVYAEGSLNVGETFTKYTLDLKPSATCNWATITIEFRGPGTLWLDNASLMPDDNVKGWRKDVFEALKALKPGIIRTGGSVVESPGYGNFDWHYLVGDPEKRTPFRAWGGLQNPRAGFPEFIELCRMVGAEPLMCAPFSRQTPKDAAEMVEYFNGSVNTPMGKKRAADGHPEPFNIKYWQVGNEQFGRDYDEGVRAFCEAMLKVDPSIKLLGNYPTAGTLKNAGDLLSYICPHHYDATNIEGCKADVEAIRQTIKENAPGHDVKIAVTEWNTTAGEWNRRAMLWTLDNALCVSRYHNLMHRNADIMEIANRSNLTNSFCSGIIQTDNHRIYKTPAYYAQWLYANLAGTIPVQIKSDMPVDMILDLSATLNDKGDELTLFVVNKNLQAMNRVLDLSVFGVKAQDAEMWVLADKKKAGEPDAINSFAEPERIVTVKSTVKVTGASQSYRFPALSLTVIRWKVK
jgi:alpha-N-arabinofuranosidase